MGLFDPDPYGGTSPWAEAAMLIGSGLMAGGAPGGGGLGALSNVGPQMTQLASRRADRGRMARAEERAVEAGQRAQEGLQLQKAGFEFKQNLALQEAQRNWRTAAAMGLPPQMLGPMPGGPQQDPGTVPIPPEGPWRASESTGLMYEPPKEAQTTGLMPPGGLMGEGYFAGVPQQVQVAAADLIQQGKAGEAIRMIEGLKKEPTERQWQAVRKSLGTSGYSPEQIAEMESNKFRYRMTQDPITGAWTVQDLLNPQGAVPPQAAPQPGPGLSVGEAPIEDPTRVAGVPDLPVGYEEVFGGTGAWETFKNDIAGMFGAEDLPAEQVERGNAAIDRLNSRTALELSEGIEGKPTDYTRKQTEKFGARPGSIFAGDERSRIGIEETVGAIDSQVEKFSAVAEDPNAPAAQRQSAMRKVTSLSALRDGWQQVLDNFENPYGEFSMEDLRGINREDLTPSQMEQVKERYKRLRDFGVPDPTEGLRGLY